MNMTQSVKQEIPEGYKQTENGMIPIDWDIVRLGNIANVVTGNTPPTSDRSNYGDEYYFVSPADLGKGKYILQTEKKLSKKGFSISRKFPPGSILFTCIGSTIGKAGIATIELTSNQQINAILPNDNFSSDFLFYFLDLIAPRIQSLAGEQAVPIVNKTDFESTLISLPSDKNEQSAIATALSHVDALIDKYEKLIEKKKNIKQGTMQELLTGKRRLTGFSGEWIRKKLGEVGEITGSGVDKKTRTDEIPVRLLNFLDVFHKTFIYSKYLNYQVTAKQDQLSRCSIKKGDIFFTPSSEMPFDIGISAIAMEDMPDVAYSYHVDRFRLFEDWDLIFRAYIFQTKEFSNQTATHCEGSGKRYVLNLTTFRERLTVFYPTNKREQAAIANILSAMDAEIEKLQSQLAKYKNIKQGMMQNLLTSKIRLNKKLWTNNQ